MNTTKAAGDFAIVTCADRNMLAAGCCALLSARQNISRPASMNLVALDITETDKNAIGLFCSHHGVEIRILPIEKQVLPKISKGRWAQAALIRLFLDQVDLPNVKRLLYLDADTLAVRSLDKLLGLDLGGNLAAAVDDYIAPFQRKLEKRRAEIGLSSKSSYFNSGVILLDWSEVRKNGTLEVARRNVENFHARYRALDQDALNAALDGNWLRIDPKWNAQTGFLREISNPSILHFTGRRKPWSPDSAWIHRGYRGIYEGYLQGTPWENTLTTKGSLKNFQDFLLDAGKRLEGARKSAMVRKFIREGGQSGMWKDES
ncbi:glycosyltransferase family 8 protein [Paracoccus sp. MBLB3053]|uniref:Glycosyltransferase family 8 protein n=1 Tax=Paracoccus aurantius TaxID=3073814 RepID=A0ABU2HXU5_9RHOB|nr:glycosyltransferase family 8 protein [Paracoccus sp. MBLB3053]MDS9469335.1 glycosyltransferase family 8 protein [Paracoccus sp. MBLB3053]